MGEWDRVTQWVICTFFPHGCFSNYKCWLAVCVIRRTLEAGLCRGLAGSVSTELWEPPCCTVAKDTGNSIVAWQAGGDVQLFTRQ